MRIQIKLLCIAQIGCTLDFYVLKGYFSDFCVCSRYLLDFYVLFVDFLCALKMLACWTYVCTEHVLLEFNYINYDGYPLYLVLV